jgi:TPR repeat protein
MALRLLIAASRRYPLAMLALARLYDPASFHANGPVRQPDAARALQLYGEAADGGTANAAAARDTLVTRLRTEAAQTGPEAAAAQAALAQAGLAPR